MKLCVLGSGSRGNAVLIQSRDTRVLIDAGFSPRGMLRRLSSIGVDPQSIEALIVTHEHCDHSRGAMAASERWGWNVYATAGTHVNCQSLTESASITIRSGTDFAIGDIRMSVVQTSHDASEPVALVATSSATGVRAGVVYDLGSVTQTVRDALDRIDILVIESNHDSAMLRDGPYPPSLKRRIAGRQGHLSNRDAGRLTAECAHRGLSHVVLAHLSETNNTPRIATESMRFALRPTPFRGSVVAASQNSPSPPIGAERAAAFGPAQLSLGL
ncbi:MAG: MBL fold metallo-hydrolase [Gemmatimonadaceae bacterium]